MAHKFDLFMKHRSAITIGLYSAQINLRAATIAKVRTVVMIKIHTIQRLQLHAVFQTASSSSFSLILRKVVDSTSAVSRIFSTQSKTSTENLIQLNAQSSRTSSEA
jgi:hypothetical protein